MSCLTSALKSLYEQTVEVVQPYNRVKQLVKVQESTVTIGENDYKLSPFGQPNCYVVGFGKAVSGMAAALDAVLGQHVAEGVISVPAGSQETFRKNRRSDLVLSPESKIRVLEGAEENLPDEKAFEAAKEIVSLVEDCEKMAENGRKPLLFALISGGGSALLPYPIEGVSLNEKMRLIRSLSLAGATIQEVNSVRKRLSKVKGGKLALLAGRNVPLVSLILSDIIGDPLDLIASSPTVRNVDKSTLAWEIVDKFNIKVPDSIVSALTSEGGTVAEEDFTHVQNVLIGNVDLALEGMQKICQSMGLRTWVASNKVSGEARKLGDFYARLAFSAIEAEDINNNSNDLMDEECFSPEVLAQFVQNVRDLRSGSLKNAKGVCLLSGGEPIVKVEGKGMGGRNQELSLSFAVAFDTLGQGQYQGVHFMSAGTDGIDGPTPAAGAIAYSTLAEDARKQGLDLRAAIGNNDSFTVLSKLNHGRELITVGHTGTNVMDVHCLVILAK